MDTTYLTHGSTEVFTAVPAEPEPLTIRPTIRSWFMDEVRDGLGSKILDEAKDLVLTIPFTLLLVLVLTGTRAPAVLTWLLQ
jgi:hypothetical protein